MAASEKIKRLENRCPVMRGAELTLLLENLEAALAALQAKYNAHLHNVAGSMYAAYQQSDALLDLAAHV